MVDCTTVVVRAASEDPPEQPSPGNGNGGGTGNGTPNGDGDGSGFEFPEVGTAGVVLAGIGAFMLLRDRGRD